jgi:hypothetical protein
MCHLTNGYWARFIDNVESCISGQVKDLGFLPEKDVNNCSAPPDVMAKLLDVIRRYATSAAKVERSIYLHIYYSGPYRARQVSSSLLTPF